MENKKRGISEYWSLGTAIGACAAIGVVVGAILNNVAMWLIIGAGIGVVLGAIGESRKREAPKK